MEFDQITKVVELDSNVIAKVVWEWEPVVSGEELKKAQKNDEKIEARGSVSAIRIFQEYYKDNAQYLSAKACKKLKQVMDEIEAESVMASAKDFDDLPF